MEAKKQTNKNVSRSNRFRFRSSETVNPFSEIRKGSRAKGVKGVKGQVAPFPPFSTTRHVDFSPRSQFCSALPCLVSSLAFVVL